MKAIAKITDRFSETEIDDEIVIMRLDNGAFFALTDTSASIWRLIDGRRDRAGLIAALAKQYAAEPRDIAADLDEFLARLRGMGLLGDA